MIQITESETRRESIKSSIMEMTASGGNVIPLGAGIQQAQAQLDQVPGAYIGREAIVLFATGEETAAPYTRPDVLPDILTTDSEIYTIGLSGNDIGNTLLSDLSNDTDGRYYLAIDAVEIPDKVNRIWEHLLGWQMLYQETLTTDELGRGCRVPVGERRRLKVGVGRGFPLGEC